MPGDHITLSCINSYVFFWGGGGGILKWIQVGEFSALEQQIDKTAID